MHYLAPEQKHMPVKTGFIRDAARNELLGTAANAFISPGFKLKHRDTFRYTHIYMPAWRIIARSV